MLLSDILKDYRCSRRGLSGGAPVIWISGLAKSGTTLVENIASCCGYVDANRSLFRNFYFKGNKKSGRVPESLFDSLPRDKASFLKSHTLYETYIDNMLSDGAVKVIVPVRDIRDALVSRMFHVLSDKNHWQHDLICKYVDRPEKMFMASISGMNPEQEIPQGEYFAKWIDSWANSKFRDRMVWYESYIANPEEYIRAVSTLMGQATIDANDVALKIRKQTSLIKKTTGSLWLRRFLFRGSSGTYRSGKIGSYSQYRSPESDEFFAQLGTRYKIYRKDIVH